MATKQEKVMAKYAAQLKKVRVPVDMKKLEKITKDLGAANYKLDSMFVAASDKKELATVHRNFVVKKLGVKGDKGMDAIMSVAKKMKKVRKKYRGAFYYAVAKELKK